jgi:citrate synthase
MTMLSAAIVCMERDSKFRNAFEEGRGRENLWTAALDDSLDLLAVLPSIAAGIYRMRYEKGPPIPHDGSLHWAANLAHMLGNDSSGFSECLRLAAVVQSDHEGGHASALTAQTVGSTLSSIYYAYSAAINALAGPNHGLASQVCLEWVIGAVDAYGGVPSDEQIGEYTLETLAGGRLIPGYGHAVLHGQDPRYLAMLAFGEKHCARSELFRTVVKMSRVVPAILIEQGKVQNPWPNVDAINGSIYHAFGITEVPFYTVLFAVALSLGITAQYVLNRALGTPIIRPRSVTTEWVRRQFGEGG